LEEIALDKKEPVFRETLRRGIWKYRDDHFGHAQELDLEKEKLTGGRLK